MSNFWIAMSMIGGLLLVVALSCFLTWLEWRAGDFDYKPAVPRPKRKRIILP